MQEPVVYNYQPFIITRWLGQTNHKPSRVKATNVTSGESIIVSWDSNFDPLGNHLRAATALYEKLGESVRRVVVCGVKNSSGYVFTAVPEWKGVNEYDLQAGTKKPV